MAMDLPQGVRICHHASFLGLPVEDYRLDDGARFASPAPSPRSPSPKTSCCRRISQSVVPLRGEAPPHE